MKFSAYKYKKFNNEDMNAVVDSMIELTEQYAKGLKDESAKEGYEEFNRTLNEKFMKVCIERTNHEFAGLDMVKDPMVTSSVGFTETFNGVISQIVTPIAPAVTSNEYNQLAEVRQIGYGDTARFPVKSNELFLVNEIAEGVQRGTLQTLFNDEITINTTNAQISVFVDWYQVASGIFDWGEFAYKMGKSFEGYIQKKIILAMTAVITDMQSNSSPYYANGFSDTNWIKTAQRVKSANGNASVYALGTLTALGTALPATAGLQYGLGEEVAKTGYLNKYKNIPLLEVGNAMEPGTINTTADLMIPDDVIYFLPLDAYKPVKVVFEGSNVTVQKDATQSVDKTYALTITMKVGVGTVIGSKFGAMIL